MKLSVCIPVYNFDVRELVHDLNKEIATSNLDAEIVLIDDASSREFLEINSQVKDSVRNFIFLEKNVGRAQIRNLFLQYVFGEYFLFLDCDGRITEPDFLQNYIRYLTEVDADVVYGGRKVQQNPPGRHDMLRWKFSVERENLSVSKRVKNPFLSFQTNNFIIKRTVFQKFGFIPEFHGYGYEDLLFAMNLKAAGIAVSHIHNPVFNNDLESNESYLRKVEESVGSLSQMLNHRETSARIDEIKLVKAYKILKKSGAENLFLRLFAATESATEKKLLSGAASLYWLDFYKLGLLAKTMKTKK